MKKVFVFAVLAVALFLLANFALASATNWMLYIQVGSPNDADQGIYNQIGVKPLATDGVDASYDPPYDLSTAGGTEKTAAQKIGNVTDTIYQRNFLSTASYSTYPAQMKKWSFRVAGLSGADTTTGIKLQFKTGASTATLPPPELGSGTYGSYGVKLVDSRGRTILKPSWAVGAGQIWNEHEMLPLPIPSTTNTVFGMIALPTIRLTSDTGQNMLDQGYELEIGPFLPEPGSLLALSAGLIGLIALARRCRFRVPG